ncbi:MAG: hypothetical protein GY755_20430 [Chloroflexi bacterium]|nr:hypothetical protein [Chloroflexota bacterium]
MDTKEKAKEFSSNTDLYAFIDRLIDKLQKTGESFWVSEFQDAIAISSMPGEILGAIRLSLLKFQKTDVFTKTKMNTDIQEAIKSLDKALGYWRPDNL